MTHRKPSVCAIQTAAPAFRRHPIASAVESCKAAAPPKFTWASKALVSAVTLGGMTAPVFANPGDCDEGNTTPSLECGEGSVANSAGSTSLGIDNLANGANTTAVGHLNEASGANSMAVGYLNTARNGTTTGTTVVGQLNHARGSFSGAFGDSNVVGDIVVDGDGNWTKDADGRLVDNTGLANADNSWAFGARNVALGGLGDDAALAVGNDNYVGSGQGSSALGHGNKVGTFVVGTDGVSVSRGPVNVNSSTAVGLNNTVTATGSSALGVNNEINNQEAIALGDTNLIEGGRSIALGGANEIYDAGTNTNGIAIGRAVTIGTDTDPVANATAIGPLASVLADDGIAMGRSSLVGASATNGIAIGFNANVVGVNSVAIGTGSIADDDLTIGIGNAGTQRRIVHQAPGINLTDGVNVSQLKGVADALGGGAGIDVDGSIIAPSYDIGGNTFGNVNGALEELEGLIGSGGTPLAVVYDDASRDIITLQGDSGATTITNVAPGLIGAGSKDAVNGGQLYGSMDSVAGLIGGGVAVNPDGTLSSPITVGGNTYASLTEAIEAGGGGGGGLCALTGADGLVCGPVNNGVFGASGDGPRPSSAVGTFNGVSGFSSGAFGHANAVGAVALNGTADAYERDVDGVLDVSGNTDNAWTFGSYNRLVAATGNDMALATGSYNRVNGTKSAAVGFDNAIGEFDLVGNVGGTNDAGYNPTGERINNATALGYSNTILAGGGTAIGGNNTVSGANAVAIGIGGTASADNAVAIGTNSVADVADTVSVGSVGNERRIVNVAPGSALTDGVNVSQLVDTVGGGIAVNPDGTFTDITVGGNTYATLAEAIEDAGGDPLAVVYDDASKVAITLAGPTSTDGGATDGTAITNLAQGDVSDGSTDAINGTQLFGLGDGVATALGGGAALNPDGSLNAPNYSIDGTAYDNVGDALSALDSGLSGALNDALLFDGVAYNATRGGNPTAITGVAPGAVNATSTDAINGAQLFGVQEDVAGNAGDIADLQTDVAQNTTDIAQNSSDIAQNTADIDALGGQVASNTSAIASNTSAINNLDGRVSSNTTAINDLDGRVGSNTTAINNLDGRVTNVEGDVVELGQQIGAVGEGAAAAQEAASAAQGTADEAVQLAIGEDGRAFCSRGAGDDSVRCGTNTQDDVTGANGIGIGTDAQAIADGSIAMGHNATAVQSNSVAIGAGARAESSVAVGTGAQATGTNTTAVGDNAVASGETAVAVGNNAQATADNSVALGNGSVADQANTVSVGSAAQQRRITNVAPGVDPTDAVNVSQLNAFRDDVNTRVYNQGRLIHSVGALSAALAMSTPDYRMKGDFQVNVGVGHYVDTQAIGATFAGLVNERMSLRVGGSYADGGESMVGAGVGFSW